MNAAGSGGGADSMPRYSMNPSAPVAGQVQVDRRRRKNTNYYNNGPRGGGGGGYRSDGRMGHRAGGDGPHNGNSSGGGSSYRGGDYDQQQSFGGTPYQMESGGHRSGGNGNHHHHHGGYHQYQHQHHHQGHNHHHHQNSSGSSMDYDGRGGDGRQQRGDGGSTSTSRIPRHDHSHNNHGHRNNGGVQVQVQPQPQETCVIHPGHPNPGGASNFGINGVAVATGGGTVPGGGGHQMGTNNEIVVVHSEHHNHVPITHFPGMPPQFPIPAPAAAPPPGAFGLVGFHPNSQPMFGTIAVCHIPYGVNPSSVISPAVFTQIIGSGVFMPGLQYNLQCAFPSPLLPAHPVIIHPQHQHQQHPAQMHQFGGIPGGGPGMPGHLAQVSESDECLAFDSSSLNPDADAFFPPAFPPEEDNDGGEGDVGSGVSGTSGGGDCNEDDEVGTGEQLKHNGADQGQDVKRQHSGQTSARSDENENILIEMDRDDIPVVSAASPRSDGEN